MTLLFEQNYTCTDLNKFLQILAVFPKSVRSTMPMVYYIYILVENTVLQL